MKLTPAQIKALQAVAEGKVELYEPHDMRKPVKIWGAHTGVITRLANANLARTYRLIYYKNLYPY